MPDLKEPLKVTHVVRNVGIGVKPNEVIIRLEKAGYPVVVSGVSAVPEIMTNFRARPMEYRLGCFIDDETIFVEWEKLRLSS